MHKANREPVCTALSCSILLRITIFAPIMVCLRVTLVDVEGVEEGTEAELVEGHDLVKDPALNVVDLEVFFAGEGAVVEGGHRHRPPLDEEENFNV